MHSRSASLAQQVRALRSTGANPSGTIIATSTLPLIGGLLLALILR